MEKTFQLVLKNEIEAKLIESILNERNIPHLIISLHDRAYDGLYQFQKGWGYLRVSELYKDEVQMIYQELPQGANETGESEQPE